jgi:AcrR family transcriptional regulator
MPRAHTEEEVARIQRRLLEHGRERFARQGLSKTTISQLSEDAGIGKGSFYRFYPSKEELFLEITRLEEQRFRQDLLDELTGSPRQLVMGLLEAPSRRVREHPFLRLLLDRDTIDELMLRLGPERMMDEQKQDRAFFFDLTRRWKKLRLLKKSVTPEEVFSSLSGLFLIELQRGLMPDEDIDRALSSLRQALLERWVAD